MTVLLALALSTSQLLQGQKKRSYGHHTILSSLEEGWYKRMEGVHFCDTAKVGE